MKTHYQIVIIGGGNAGISTAAQLIKKRKSLEIAIIEPSEFHYYQPAWTLAAGGVFDITKTKKQQKDFIPIGVKWIQDKVTTINATQNQLQLQSNTTLTYNVLIVCPGIQIDWNKIDGLKEALQKENVNSVYSYDTAQKMFQSLKNFKSGNAIFTSPNTPVKCGGAPQKIMYLTADFLRKKKLRKENMIHFYSGGSMIFGVKKYANTLEKVISRYDIQTHFKHNLFKIDSENNIAYFKFLDTNNIEQITKVPYGLLHVTPPQSAPDFIKNSELAEPSNPLGWVDVNKHTLQHKIFKNVFALGDVTNTANAKTGAAIRKQAPVIVNNILSFIDNTELINSYNGYGSCPLITGYGKLVLAEFDYANQPTETFPFDQSKERLSMYLMKTKLLPWLYWNKILKGKM